MFLWYDYLILVIVPLISASIGVHFGCFGNKQNTTKDYLSGGKSITFFPIALSVTVSHFSAVTLVGLPADVYKYGAFYWLSCISIFFLTILAIYVYYPVLFQQQLTSIYEYLEKRFDYKTRIIGSVMYVLYENLLLPVIVYSPALALSVGINLNVISITICSIVVFYTAIGGLRTVIWTDILQFAVIIFTLSVLAIFGIVRANGFSAVWNKALAGQRLDIFDLDLDPTKKDSFFIIAVGFIPRFLFYLCLTQSAVQKYLSLPTFRDCKRAIILSGFCYCIVVTFATALGLIIYANYVNCDPVLSQKIKRNDELVSYYVEEVARVIPGVSGLLMAALVSAAISTLSSSLNSLSGVIYKDFVAKFLPSDISERKCVAILKTIVVAQGVLCTSLVLIVQHLGEIMPLIIGLSGLIDGPSVGLFTLAILVPKANANGAFYGAVGGLLFIATIFCTSTYYKYNNVFVYPSRPLSTESCNISDLSTNFTSTAFSSINNITTITPKSFNQPHFIFRISPSYYCLMGATVTMALALLLSYFWKTPKSSSNNTVPLLVKSNIDQD